MNESISLRDALAIQILGTLIIVDRQAKYPMLDVDEIRSWLNNNDRWAGNTENSLKDLIRGSYKIADLFREVRLEQFKDDNSK